MKKAAASVAVALSFAVAGGDAAEVTFEVEELAVDGGNIDASGLQIVGHNMSSVDVSSNDVDWLLNDGAVSFGNPTNPQVLVGRNNAPGGGANAAETFANGAPAVDAYFGADTETALHQAIESIAFQSPSFDLNIDGLITGQDYRVQIISWDAGVEGEIVDKVFRRSTISATSAGDSGSLDFNQFAIDGPDDGSAVGNSSDEITAALITAEFTATSSDISFTLAGAEENPTAIYNALLVHEVGLPQMALRVDRGTGEMVFANESESGSPFAFSAYSILSDSGETLTQDGWQSIAESGDVDSGASIDDVDRWVEFSDPSSTADLSEAEAPVGDGVSLAPGQSISLGRGWRRGTFEDLTMQAVNERDQVVEVEVRFEGQFVAGDYDHNGVVDVADYIRWREQFGLTGANLDADGNLDGAVDAADYTLWRDGYAIGSAPVVAAPEPTLASWLAGALGLAILVRRRSLVTARSALALLLASCPLAFSSGPRQAAAQSLIPVGDTAVRIEKLVEGLNGELTGNTADTRKQYIPIDMTPLGDGRQLVLTLGGHVRMLEADGTLASGAYLDTTNARTPDIDDTDFRNIGALSIAAHPGFLDSQSRGYGKFYTITSETTLPEHPSGFEATADFSLVVTASDSYVIDNVVNEWTIAPSAFTDSQLAWTPNGGDPNDTVAVREVLRSQRPGIIHMLADMAFDPSENLLITSGDGGGNAFPNTDGSAGGQSNTENALDPRNIFGSLLRIDPLPLPNDTRATGGQNEQYYIPDDNFFHVDGDPDTPSEFVAFGLRSPYRMNVDQVTGDIFIGDVGQDHREEVSKVANGGNYGWGAYEGTDVEINGLVDQADDIVAPTDPIFELYHNLNGQSEAVNVVGGFVYRGSAIPELEGMYFFAETGENDQTQPTNVLDIYYGDPDSTDSSSRDDLFRLQLELPDGMPDRIWSIGEDEEGELYLLVGPTRLPPTGNPVDAFTVAPGATDGGIWRVLPTEFPLLNGIPGDVNQDGVVSGDGTDPAGVDDVTAFIQGWLSAGFESDYERVTNGDLNLDGITDLFDWVILRANHESGSELDLAALLAIPEPATSCLLVGVVLGFSIKRRRE